MTSSRPAGEAEALAFFLGAQRDSVLAIVAGLDEDQLTCAVVPSGWTMAGMLEHLAEAERAWFDLVIGGGTDGPERGDALDLEGRTAGDVIARYRERIVRSDEVLAGRPLDAPAAGPPVADIGIAADALTVRDVVLHMIEETARHAGHLDIARELIDGRTGLGPR